MNKNERERENKILVIFQWAKPEEYWITTYKKVYDQSRLRTG